MPDLPLWVWVLAVVVGLVAVIYFCISDEAAESWLADLFGDSEEGE
jgi:hypothetical protein